MEDYCGKDVINQSFMQYKKIRKNKEEVHTFQETFAFTMLTYNMIVYFDMEKDSIACILHDNYLKRIGKDAKPELQKSYCLLEPNQKEPYDLIYKIVFKNAVEN